MSEGNRLYVCVRACTNKRDDKEGEASYLRMNLLFSFLLLLEEAAEAAIAVAHSVYGATLSIMCENEMMLREEIKSVLVSFLSLVLSYR